MSSAAGLARLATQPGAVEVALGRNRQPVSERLIVQGWNRAGTTISASIQFGPYGERVDAEHVLVWVGGEGPDVIAFNGSLGLPAGVPFTFDLTLTVEN